MKKLQPHYSKAEFARRGQDIYEREVEPRLQSGEDGKFIAIDIESGDYVADEDDYTATERLLARKPDAQIWLMRAGRSAAYTIGGR